MASTTAPHATPNRSPNASDADADRSGHPARRSLPDELINTSIWSDELVAHAGIRVVDAPIVSVGGGIGSFVFVDMLRIAGVPAGDIAVLSNLQAPWQTYEYLTRVSQIPRHERLRSDSASCPDNIWGFPGYALREAWNAKRPGPALNVLAEPVLADFYTPKAGHVFETMASEARRIDYGSTVHNGQVRLIRRRAGGGYLTLLTAPSGERIAYRSGYVHIAVGYAGLRFLPDLQAFRDAHDDRVRVVNAYESHEHVYDTLRRRGGTVVVRGGGIVASRILQRLMDDRQHHGARTTIVQVLRTFVDGPNATYGRARRKGGGGVAYQGFNWPKSAWGGQLREHFERLDGEARADLYAQVGGTQTPWRRSWQRQIKTATAEGWYTVRQGEVRSLQPRDDGRLSLQIESQRDPADPTELDVDFVIDCTGLDADIDESPLLADLLRHGGAGRNPLGKLDVERTFEVRGTRSEPGRMYAVGQATLGGYYAGVDTFLGLQYAALRVADDLADIGAVPRLTTGRSLRQWWRWARHRPVD